MTSVSVYSHKKSFCGLENSKQANECKVGSECVDFATVFTPKWVKLNSVDEGDPVFMFPGIEGKASDFRDLAAGLPCPAIGMQYVMHNDCYSSIPELAEDCLKVILEHCQPEQHFSIIGHSFGCAVAHELVVLLQNSGMGDRLKCLVWIEGSSEFIHLFAREALGMGDTGEYYFSFADEESQTKVLYASLNWLGVTSDLEKVVHQLEQLPDFNARCGMVAELLTEELGLRVTVQDVISASHCLLTKHRSAFYYIANEKIKGSVIFFKASIGFLPQLPPNYNIGKDFDGCVSSYYVPGAHLTVLKREGCKKISRILKPKLL